jgi:cbb3-type cytochrome oxidase maturation protein
MGVILLLVLASLGIATAFLLAFVWAVRAGHFEDTCTPALRILAEGERPGARPPHPTVWPSGPVRERPQPDPTTQPPAA